MAVHSEHIRGTSVRFETLFKDVTETASNASGVWANLTDVNSNMIGSTSSATASGTGIYYWETTIPPTGSLGFWRIDWTGSVNNLPTRNVEVFRVKEPRQL